MLMPITSLAETDVVHPVKVVEYLLVPVESAGSADAVIVFDTVGIAVPVAIFQTSNVTVPASTEMFQLLIVQACPTEK
jgi:hypothetical protein